MAKPITRTAEDQRVMDIIQGAGEIAAQCGMDLYAIVRAANQVYSAGGREPALRSLQRYTADVKMVGPNPEGWDWHLWSPEQLAGYIKGVRINHPDAYGKYCQWVGCEETRMHENHFCVSHEIVARANENP